MKELTSDPQMSTQEVEVAADGGTGLLERSFTQLCSGSHFNVLNRLPLSPNGKVDKPNLPFLVVAELTEEASHEDLKR